MTHTMSKSYNNYRKGEEFQEEMRRSWSLLPNWRHRLRDGRGLENPGDEVILLNSCNILAEHKRTNGDQFKLSMLEESQKTGLLQFDNALDHNIGMVFVDFEEFGECYAFRFLKALQWMDKHGRKSVPLQVFRDKGFPMIFYLPRIKIDGKPAYDVRKLFGGVE